MTDSADCICGRHGDIEPVEMLFRESIRPHEPPRRVLIGWMHGGVFARVEIDDRASLAPQHQAAIELAWERLERGMVGDIGPYVVVG